jgi:hypothetical protein
MALLPLLGGAYVARSVIAEAQRCLNLYPETNPKDAVTPTTHYPTPGLTRLGAAPIAGMWRGLYFATNRVLYGVCGPKVYSINESWVCTELGTIPNATTPVSMTDNGEYLIIVDGGAVGWTVELGSGIFAPIADANFLGADFVGYLDTFLVFNEPGTKNFYSSDSNAITFDPTYKAGKTGFPDKIVALVVNHVEIWLIGERTTEIWSNAGTPGLPFQRIAGVFIQHGCAAKYSVASYNLQLFWLSQDNNGQALVLLGSNYQVKNISTPALSDALAKYSAIDDAIGFVYQQGNHVFYVLTFPTESKTWCYDMSTDMWHERAYVDSNGVEQRIRANCTAFAYGQNVVGDWNNGLLYSLDLNNFTDNGTPIVRRRGFPHVMNDGKVVYHAQFIANVEVGTGSGNENPLPGMEARTPVLNLRWSDTKGKTWSQPVAASLGAIGEYETAPSWRDLGSARDRVYELFWSENCMVALNGAYVDMIPLPV